MWDVYRAKSNIVKHRIQFFAAGEEPIHSTPYRGGPEARKLENNEVEKMLSGREVESTQTDLATPIMFALKKDGCLRFCVNYWKLNGVTKRNVYLIPRMDDCVAQFEQAEVFPTLNANR